MNTEQPICKDCGAQRRDGEAAYISLWIPSDPAIKPGSYAFCVPCAQKREGTR